MGLFTGEPDWRDPGELRHGDGSLCGIHHFSARCINEALLEGAPASAESDEAAP